MPTGGTLATVAVSGFALSLSPGPSMFYVLSRSVSQSRAAGLTSALGLAAGGVLLAIASALGLVALFERWPFALTAVQVAGGAYLLFLGVGAIREAEGARRLKPEVLAAVPLTRVFGQGVLVEALNPKTALFLVAFIPQFVEPADGNTFWQILILGVLVPLTAIPCDVAVSFSGGAIANRFRAKPFAAVALNWVSGLILIGLAARVVLLAAGY